MRRCPYCAEDIQDAAIVCKHCQRDLPATATPPVSKPVSAVVATARPSGNKKALALLAVAVGFALVLASQSEARTFRLFDGVLVMWIGFGFLLTGPGRIRWGGGLILSLVLGLVGLGLSANSVRSRGDQQQQAQAAEQVRQAELRAASLLAQMQQAVSTNQWREAAKLNAQVKTLNANLAGRAEGEKIINDHLRVLDINDGIAEAARVSTDPKQCVQPTAIAGAWNKLKQVRPADPAWSAASTAAAKLEECRKRAERDLSAALRGIMVAQREAWSKKSDTVFLDNGMNVAISLTGANKDSAILKWALFSRAAAHKMTDGGSMTPDSFLGGLQKIGFRRVTFTDGFDESWFYDLHPQDEAKSGLMVLEQNGIGQPLTLTR